MFRSTLTRTVLALLLASGVLGGALLSPASPASAAASMRLSRYNAAAGDRVNAIGYGFHAGDDVVVTTDVRVGGSTQHVQTTGLVDNNGSFTATFTVPGGTTQATYRVSARDFHGNAAAQNLTVLPNAFVKVGGATPTAYVIPGHDFYVSGSGFTAGEAVRVLAVFPLYNGNSYEVTKTVSANGNGGFYEMLLRAPSGASKGNVSLTATGQSSKRVARATLSVFYRPTIVPGAGTVRPGTSVTVKGRDFVANSSVRLTVDVARNGTTNVTLSRTVGADGNGAFQTSIALPGNIRNGRYTVVATDLVGGFRAYTSFTVSVHPTLSLEPRTAFPGQSLTVTGANFGSGVQVHVFATFPVQGGGNHAVGTYVNANGAGAFTTSITVPTNAASGRTTVYGRSANGQATDQVQINQKPTVAPTSTSVPATATPTPKPASKPKLFFKYVSVWYHVVRQGTYDHVAIQANIYRTLGIWMHVYFPTGQHYDYYTNTDSSGHFEKTFGIPRHAITAKSNQAIVTFQLWKGHQSRKNFRSFTLV